MAGIDFDVQRGEVLAFLGPNGAGKTTTVEILEGYRQRSGGQVQVLGEDPADASLLWRDRLGIVLQDSAIEPDLTVQECLELYAGYHLHPRPVEEVLALVDLTARATTLGARLSGGQRRRLDVALALIGDPELVFLDEPTTGFDPAARRQAWDVIASLRGLGKTIFLTTHFMDEAEYLADRIIVVAGGAIVAEGPPRTLAGRQTPSGPGALHAPCSHRPRPTPCPTGHPRDSGGGRCYTGDKFPAPIRFGAARSVGGRPGHRSARPRGQASDARRHLSGAYRGAVRMSLAIARAARATDTHAGHAAGAGWTSVRL